MIRLESVARRFPGLTVFEGLSWQLDPGERIGLVGPNGAGKTTLLRILGGLEETDEGRIERQRGLRVGYLAQDVETEGFLGGSLLAAVLEGFPELRDLETEIEALEEELALAAGDPHRLARATARYGDVRSRFEALGGYAHEAEGKAALQGLGFEPGAFHRPVADLSGGWRMRAALARLLVGRPDVLLLDEPSNHLDLESLLWLEGWLASFAGTVVIVSHDRYLLNRTASRIAELERGRLTPYAGSYDDYVAERERRREALAAARKQQDREVARTRRFIERFRYKNTKARQVQSRLKRLEQIERIEVAPSRRLARFRFPPAPRSAEDVVVVEGLVKRYGGTVVYEGADLRVRRGDRLALMGPNGAGKTTLLRVLAGAVPYEGGRVRIGHNVSVGYYAQHQLEALDPASTVLEEIARAMPAETPERQRSHLGALLFSGDDVDKRVAVLSGGEKARLALAKLMARPTNLFLLDEPTNHLDLQAREVLEDALNEYEGTLVVVSHDRYFINRVVTETVDVGRRALVRYPGDYDAYLEARAREAAGAAPAAATDPGAAPVAAGVRVRREQRRAEAEERQRRSRELRPYRERLAAVEAEIASLEARLAALAEAQADPGAYADGERARTIAVERREVERRLAPLYEEWSALGERIARIDARE